MANWNPTRPAMGQKSAAETQMLGVAVLSAISIAGIHSAICPSYFTMKTFASQPEAKERSMEGLWISLGVSTVTSLSLYLVFKNWMPVIFAQATALLLFGIGVAATNSEPPKTIPPIEQQSVVTKPTAQPVVGPVF
jgi:hypothetical protein